MNDDLARELISAVRDHTAALTARWAEEDDRLTGAKRAAESEELNLLRPMLASALAKADQLRERARSAEAIAESVSDQLDVVTRERDQLVDQLRSAADLTDITLTDERTR